MSDSAARTFSVVLTHDGKETRIDAKTPFTIGRSPGMDLVLPYPYISRHHADIQLDPAQQGLELIGISRECFVNGSRVDRHRIEPGDEIRLGFLEGPKLRTADRPGPGSSLRETLDQLKQPSGADADLTKLSWFVRAAQRLNTVGAVQEILAALLDTTLELTHFERGYVFLKDSAPELHVAVGRSSRGDDPGDGSTLSRSAIQQAIDSGSEFIVTDSLSAEAANPSHSMILQSIRAIICIPLRKRSPQLSSSDSQVLGVLYLDSQQRNRLTRMDGELLRTIAVEATLLVENAALVQAEIAARRDREELLIASRIQQSLMSVRIPRLSFAEVEANSIPCTGIGGDFYDVLCHNDALYVVVADISGKGVSAAVLGSTLQGLIHGQILSNLPLASIASFANEYICHKSVGKYATLILLRLAQDGTAEYINCGHVQPLIHTSDAAPEHSIVAAHNCNLPVGLFPNATYTADVLRLLPGQRIFITTDGVTEAEDLSGRCFGEGLLQSLVRSGETLGEIFREIGAFIAGTPPQDDCTMVEVRYRPAGAGSTQDATPPCS